MSADPWHVDRLDLAGYLERLGVAVREPSRAAVDDAGYAGPIEVEIFNPEIWSRPGDKILATMKERYASLV